MSDDLRPATDALIRHAILLQQVADLRPDTRPTHRPDMDKVWADFDAAYPQPLDLKPNAKP